MKNIDKAGWLVAAGLVGILVGSGFQGSTEKTGVVDLTKVVEQSEYGKANQATFNQMKDAREGVLMFIDQNRVMTVDQAQKIKDLSLKLNPTPAEKADLDKTKNEVIAATKKQLELSQKTNQTKEELELLNDYSNRVQTTAQTAQRWYREFTNSMQDWADKQKADSIEKARAIVKEVGKAQGYTVVFKSGIAPYGANDLSDAALKQMDAKK